VLLALRLAFTHVCFLRAADLFGCLAASWTRDRVERTVIRKKALASCRKRCLARWDAFRGQKSPYFRVSGIRKGLYVSGIRKGLYVMCGFKKSILQHVVLGERNRGKSPYFRVSGIRKGLHLTRGFQKVDITACCYGRE